MVITLLLIRLFIVSSSIEVNTWVFFPRKCIRTAAKTMVVDRKKEQKAIALPHLASGQVANAANSSDVPTKFAAKNTTKMKSEKIKL